MRKFFGSLLVVASLAFLGLGTVASTGCSSNTGVIDGAPGEEEPAIELSEEEEAAENAIGDEDGDGDGEGEGE